MQRLAPSTSPEKRIVPALDIRPAEATFFAKLPDGITCFFTKILVWIFDTDSHEHAEGISGEVHGNLEADLAVLTPACSSFSFYGRTLPG